MREVFRTAAVALLMWAAACGRDPLSGDRMLIAELDAIVIEPESSTVLGITLRNGGATYRSFGTSAPAWPADEQVSWRTDNDAVASINDNGRIVALTPGVTMARALVGELEAYTTVHVRASSEPTARYHTIAAGDAFTCGVTVDGTGYCWGSNWMGTLGNGRVRPFSGTAAPTLVEVPAALQSIDAGATHACGLSTSGFAYCWGANYNGERSGGGTTANGRPELVSPSLQLRMLSVGNSVTCGLNIDGAAYCWGLLDGRRIETPKKIGGPAFKTVSAGGVHACALTNDGTAFCWGPPGADQLGIAGVADASIPQPVQTAQKFKAISSGLAHTCGIELGGALYCWGTGQGGRLGTGDHQPRTVPTKVASSEAFTNVTAGALHTCAVATSGASYCWGSNLRAQIGDSTAYFANSTAAELAILFPRRVSTDLALATVVASSLDHSCALTTDGRAVCWGSNAWGQLGLGFRQLFPGTELFLSRVPVKVTDPP